MALTVRNRILNHLVERFRDVRVGVDEHVVTWNQVLRGELHDVEQQVGDAIVLIEGREEKNDRVQYVDVDLRLVTEFWVRVPTGEDRAERLNEVMGDVFRTMRSDVNSTTSTSPLCQLTVDITEFSNEVELETGGDRLVGGAIVWSILYRHKPLDSTKLLGE